MKGERGGKSKVQPCGWIFKNEGALNPLIKHSPWLWLGQGEKPDGPFLKGLPGLALAWWQAKAGTLPATVTVAEAVGAHPHRLADWAVLAQPALWPTLGQPEAGFIGPLRGLSPGLGLAREQGAHPCPLPPSGAHPRERKASLAEDRVRRHLPPASFTGGVMPPVNN